MSDYATMQYRLMPTKRSKRFVKPRTSQRIARPYNVASAKTREVRERTFTQSPTFMTTPETKRLFTCNDCGRSEMTTQAAFAMHREVHN